MADQFCRIACTGICDMTLDSNGVQTLVTTDANCSFVIRELYKADDEPNNSVVCYKGDLIMDGVTVLCGFSTQANGTLIVPPSTTLCYKETSGNYPLSFSCFCHHQFLCAGTNCGGGNQYRHKIIGNGGSDKTTLFNAPCLTSFCCNNYPDKGTIAWHPATCTYAFSYHDGNSTSTFFLMCKNCTTNSYSLVFSCGSGYCTWAVANDMATHACGTDFYHLYNWGRCNCASCCRICFCSFSGSAQSTYSSSAISSTGHPCHHCGCRAIVEVAENGTGATQKMFAIDACCSVSGLRHKSELLWCSTRGNMPTGWCGMAGANDSYFLFTYYSKYCDAWLAGVWSYGCMSVLNETGTDETFVCFGTDYNNSCFCAVSVAGDKFFVHKNCTCKKQFINLDSFIQGTQEFSDVISGETYSGSCNWCYECTCDSSGNHCAAFFYGVSTKSEFSGNSCDYTSADKKTKIRIYGIKST